MRPKAKRTFTRALMGALLAFACAGLLYLFAAPLVYLYLTHNWSGFFSWVALYFLFPLAIYALHLFFAPQVLGDILYHLRSHRRARTKAAPSGRGAAPAGERPRASSPDRPPEERRSR